MELFEFVLIILLCVLVSTVIDKFVRRISLPVLQIIVGVVAALVIPAVSDVEGLESELFLVLFIAPLLFNETRTASVRQLWTNKGSILSLAIGLVVASVLAVGYTLHWLVPSIPLAAAFALGAALGPTDAAAVGALKSQVNLSDRQRTLLSGESLINDASGVVAFQFSVAAAVTGAFSLAEAVGQFLVLFLGGILAGIVLGLLLSGLSRMLGSFGFEDVTAHAFYELISPFVIYLVAEAVGVSGILAVVAGGLVMNRRRPTFHSTFESRRKLVSDSLWDVVEMLINGVLFVMLGMQLPHVVMPGLSGDLTGWQVIGVIAAIAATSIACRFVWILGMEAFHRRHETDHEGEGGIVRDALVTTIAGAKGAVTLSIILTLPFTVASGAPFPQRDLIITLTSGTILLTLVLADTLLPVLAPKPQDDGEHDREMRAARQAVREATTAELLRIMDQPGLEDYVPATRLTVTQYQLRSAMEQLSDPTVSGANDEIEDEEYELQVQELERLHQRHLKRHDEADWQLHLRAMRGIRRSVGYRGQMSQVIPGNIAHGFLDLMRQYVLPRRRDEFDEAEFTRVYAQSCMYCLELEYVSIDLFDRFIAEGTPQQQEAARVRKQSHELSVRSIWSRLNYGRDVPLDSSEGYTLPYNPATGEFDVDFTDQFRKAREYARDVRENALRIELDEIVQLQRDGVFDRDIANELRDEVYLLQMSDV